jgi:cytochrome c oxidase cbb3-type subunit III
MSDREPILHVYDDIEEADNELPRWWVWTFVLCVLFAGGYFLYYQVFKTGDTPLVSYQKARRRLAEEEAERLKAGGDFTPDKLVAMSKNAAILGAGKAVFSQTCAACHGPNGGGTVGPNLTDGFWLAGGKPDQILATIRQGRVQKGMPAWGMQLGEARVRDVAAYIVSLKDTNVPGGKPPQGQRE